MNKYFLKQNFQFFFILLWISLWASIGTLPFAGDLSEIKINKNNLIYYSRVYSPVILFSLIVIISVFKKINLKLNNFKFTLIFITIFLCQGIGTFLNVDKGFTFYELYLVIFSLISIMTISSLDIKNLKKFQYINLFFIFLAFIVFIYPVYKSFFNPYNINIFMYVYDGWDKSTFGTPNTRVTGIARYCFVIICFIYSYLIVCQYNKLSGCILIILLVFFSINIWLLQSRLIIGSFFIIFFTSLIFRQNKFSRIKLTLCFFILCGIVYLCSFQIQKNKIELGAFFYKKIIEDIDRSDEKNIKDFNTSDQSNIKDFNTSDQSNIKNSQTLVNNFKSARLSSNTSSSGRVQIWSEILNAYDLSKIFGYGSQADRYLLNDPDRSLSTNASNAIIYTISSGGYFALFLLIVIIFKSLKINYQILKLNFKGINLNFIDMTSFLLILFFLLRQLVENSFAYFGVDYMIFLNSFFYLSKRLEK